MSGSNEDLVEMRSLSSKILKHSASLGVSPRTLRLQELADFLWLLVIQLTKLVGTTSAIHCHLPPALLNRLLNICATVIPPTTKSRPFKMFSHLEHLCALLGTSVVSWTFSNFSQTSTHIQSPKFHAALDTQWAILPPPLLGAMAYSCSRFLSFKFTSCTWVLFTSFFISTTFFPSFTTSHCPSSGDSLPRYCNHHFFRSRVSIHQSIMTRRDQIYWTWPHLHLRSDDSRIPRPLQETSRLKVRRHAWDPTQTKHGWQGRERKHQVSKFTHPPNTRPKARFRLSTDMLLVWRWSTVFIVHHAPPSLSHFDPGQSASWWAGERHLQHLRARFTLQAHFPPGATSLQGPNLPAQE